MPLLQPLLLPLLQPLLLPLLPLLLYRLFAQCSYHQHQRKKFYPSPYQQ
jgi:hypothetical protein